MTANGGNGNGAKRQLLTIAVTALCSVLGTMFCLWITVGGKYLNREEVYQIVEESSRRDRDAMTGTLNTLMKNVDMVTKDVKDVLKDIAETKIQAGITADRVDDIRARMVKLK